ncbi:MYXO-CTERM sorting domain-containing protein [Streptomyces sp. NPDC054784]
MATPHGHPQQRPAPAGTAPSPRNGFGVAALVLGLLALVTFWTVFGGIALGVLALAFGVLGHRRKRRGEATNGTMALVGAVAGLLALLASSVMLIAGLTFFNSEEFKDYQDCADHADTQSEREKCAEDFGEDVTE